MFYINYLILLPLIVATLHINFYYDPDSASKSDIMLQYNCFRVTADIEHAKSHRQIISYCMNEFSSKVLVEKNNFFPKFTFAELSRRNITSQQLYLWSASIDAAERYQLYLNQISTVSTEVFYNCTLPRFGPLCQYELDYYHPNHSTLYEIIHDFYHNTLYNPMNLTCYTHLNCTRHSYSLCLDWSEICDGKVDCLNNGLDEEYCWQLDLNNCDDDNEFQCTNGQCIPKSYYLDQQFFSDCLDGSDEIGGNYHNYDTCMTAEPSSKCEDITCAHTLLTMSCVRQRGSLLLSALFSVKDSSILDDCWYAFLCILNLQDKIDFRCVDFCESDMCVPIIKSKCPDMLFIPSVPILFGHIYFAYQKNTSHLLTNYDLHYPYVCYNNSRYDVYFINATKVFFNNITCYHRNDTVSIWPVASDWADLYLATYKTDLWVYNQIWRYNQTFNYTSIKCNRSNMYQCIDSPKCISVYEKNNGKRDCLYGDDENSTEMYEVLLTEERMGIPRFENEKSKMKLRYARKNISFQTICDGFTELFPVDINGRQETDETECEQWACTNIYTRCNGIWNCPDGADELGCESDLPLNCSADHRLCVSPNTTRLMCLPITNMNDGQIDCIGATDEPQICRSKYLWDFKYSFHCTRVGFVICHAYDELCNGKEGCLFFADDENFCNQNRTIPWGESICLPQNLQFASDAEKFLCEHTKNSDKQQIVYFSLEETRKSVDDEGTNVDDIASPSQSLVQMSYERRYGCHRGLPLHIWLNKQNTRITSTCLCPPSFYGDRCQYQNQRISLTSEFRALSDSFQIPFAIIISLIDDSDQRIIHSYEQFTYLSMRDCKIKFDIYLIYSTRPKDPTKQYSIHMDIYEKISFIYRGSFLFPITFTFLPVYRLAILVYIPGNNNKQTQRCSQNQCKHGKCIRYANNPDGLTFCQCDEGWSGRYCTIQHTCQCSLGSLCIGMSANNRSICVCPVQKFGPRCLLINPLCQTGQNTTCKNNGQCIPDDDYMISDQKFTCICPKGFSGDRCEIIENKIILSFETNLVLPQSIYIHFIHVTNKSPPIRFNILKTIPVKQDSITIYWSQPFHIVVTQLSDSGYYLTAVQKRYNQSTTINKMITASDRCRNISEVLNETLVQLNPLRRIKYYQLPCQNYSPDLQCFYDDLHLCLCYDFGEQRLANCFHFYPNISFRCNINDCENGAECYQDTIDCPKSVVCVCPPCYYGTRCQFSASGHGLSLDAILGYHILPHVSLNQQPFITQISFALTIIFLVIGLINGIMCIMVFKNKTAREVGCGLYLFGSSITTLLTMMMFGLKFVILLLAQMAILSNRSFLQVQCISLDFILRVSLFTDQWLNACVAVERAMTAVKGTQFDRKKSKQIAKYVIILLLIVIVGTCIHDPFHRRLIDEGTYDEDEKRIWCIISYSPSIEIYHSTVHIFHFLGPFLVNLISAVILITSKSRQQSNVHQQRSYKEHLREQCQQHKNLLTAPVLLVLLAIPRLIISFVSKCMKSANDSWLFLIGYFISFIPSMLTFLVFIVPSKFYQKEFRKSLASYRTYLRRYLRCSS